MNTVGQIVYLVQENLALETKLEAQSIGQQFNVDDLTQRNGFLKVQRRCLASQMNIRDEQIATLAGIIQGRSGQGGTVPVSESALPVQVAGVIQENSALKTESLVQLSGHQTRIAAIAEKNSLLKNKLTACTSQLTYQAEQITSLINRVLTGSGQKAALPGQPTAAQVACLIQKNCFLRAEIGFQLASYQNKMAFLAQESELLKRTQDRGVFQLARRSEWVNALMKRVFERPGEQVASAVQPSVPAHITDAIQENGFLRAEFSFLLVTQAATVAILTQENNFLNEEWARAVSQISCQAEQISFLMKLA
jgi:hypothetical protein